jgi:hypothetical protein
VSLLEISLLRRAAVISRPVGRRQYSTVLEHRCVGHKSAPVRWNAGLIHTAPPKSSSAALYLYQSMGIHK